MEEDERKQQKTNKELYVDARTNRGLRQSMEGDEKKWKRKKWHQCWWKD
jgi:hypothetical protein